MGSSKKCSCCSEAKAAALFYKRTLSPDGLTSSCKDCIEARRKAPDLERHRGYNRRSYQKNGANWKGTRKAWRSRNQEKERERTRLWAKEHPLLIREKRMRRRARMRGNESKPISYAAVIQRCGMVCGFCGLAVTADDLSFDHIIPIAHGGAHAEENLRVAHFLCNSVAGGAIRAS